jgi:hypothetical protein
MSKKHSKRSWQPSISWYVIGWLAIVAVPRVVFHDLHLLAVDSTMYQVLTLVPWLVWLVAAVFVRTKRPFYDFFLVGVVFGCMLALTHQILWDASWGDDVPRLGGNLEGTLAPWAEIAVLRAAAVISSLLTGVMAGVGLGFVAWLAAWVSRMKP